MPRASRAATVDELIQLDLAMTEIRQKRLRQLDVLERLLFRHVTFESHYDSSTCSRCMKRNGKLVTLNAARKLLDKAYCCARVKGVPAPCRCSMLPTIPDLPDPSLRNLEQWFVLHRMRNSLPIGLAITSIEPPPDGGRHVAATIGLSSPGSGLDVAAEMRAALANPVPPSPLDRGEAFVANLLAVNRRTPRRVVAHEVTASIRDSIRRSLDAAQAPPRLPPALSRADLAPDFVAELERIEAMTKRGVDASPAATDLPAQPAR